MITVQNLLDLPSLEICHDYEIELYMNNIIDEYDPLVSSWFKNYDFESHKGRAFITQFRADVVLRGNNINHDNLENTVVRLSWNRQPFALVRTRDTDPDNDDDDASPSVIISDTKTIIKIAAMLTSLRTEENYDLYVKPEGNADAFLKGCDGTPRLETGEICYEKIHNIMTLVNHKTASAALAYIENKGWVYENNVFSHVVSDADEALKGFIGLLSDIPDNKTPIIFVNLGDNGSRPSHVYRDARTNSVYVCTEHEHTGTDFSNSEESTAFFLSECERCGRDVVREIENTVHARPNP